MEALLSHSFDYLSSPSPQKIRKGLRQVEGLLTQICVSRTTEGHSSLALDSDPRVTTKKLGDLYDDPAYREFFKLQQSFKYNVIMRLVACLERLLGKESSGTNDLLVIQTLDLIQGVLLLHAPSRELFGQEIYMNVSMLLDPFCRLHSLTCIDLPRPARSLQLSCHPIVYASSAGHLLARSTTEHQNVRDSGRVACGDLPIQISIDFSRG